MDDNSSASFSSADHEETTTVNNMNGEPEPGSLIQVDQKPRLLLMGLKRYMINLILYNHPYANECSQEREVVDIERSFS